MTGRLVCLGAIVIDVTATVPALPQRGGDVLAHSGAMLAGGSGFNVMAAAGRLGRRAVYGGMHGTGPFGDLARAAMDAENIDVLLVPDDDCDTGWDVAITDAGSERTFITVVGAEARLTVAGLARVAAHAGDTVYVSGYGLLRDPARTAITRWLGTLPAGVRVVTDPGPLVTDIPVDTLETVRAVTTWFSCSSAEATAITGCLDPIEAVRTLSASQRGVIVRLGADGAVAAVPGGDPVLVSGFPVDAVDTNGAGDAHTGAFIASLMDGATPLDAVRRANAAAAMSVTRAGPATGPTTDELNRFLSSAAW